MSFGNNCIIKPTLFGVSAIAVYLRHQLNHHYGPQPIPLHPKGSVYILNGKSVTTVGYFEYSKEKTGQDIDYLRSIWITGNMELAVKSVLKYHPSGKIAEVVIDASSRFDISPYPVFSKGLGLQSQSYFVFPNEISKMNLRVVSERRAHVDKLQHRPGVIADLNRFIHGIRREKVNQQND